MKTWCTIQVLSLMLFNLNLIQIYTYWVNTSSFCNTSNGSDALGSLVQVYWRTCINENANETHPILPRNRPQGISILDFIIVNGSVTGPLHLWSWVQSLFRLKRIKEFILTIPKPIKEWKEPWLLLLLSCFPGILENRNKVKKNETEFNNVSGLPIKKIIMGVFFPFHIKMHLNAWKSQACFHNSKLISSFLSF
jgi:hypothetical protein